MHIHQKYNRRVVVCGWLVAKRPAKKRTVFTFTAIQNVGFMPCACRQTAWNGTEHKLPLLDRTNPRWLHTQHWARWARSPSGRTRPSPTLIYVRTFSTRVPRSSGGSKQQRSRRQHAAQQQQPSRRRLSSFPGATASTSPRAKTSRSGSNSSMKPDGDGRPADGINRASILPDSAHRDGSIYSVTNGWHKQYRISDVNESESISLLFIF